MLTGTAQGDRQCGYAGVCAKDRDQSLCKCPAGHADVGRMQHAGLQTGSTLVFQFGPKNLWQQRANIIVFSLRPIRHFADGPKSNMWHSRAAEHAMNKAQPDHNQAELEIK
jgi:hypothetical protein